MANEKRYKSWGRKPMQDRTIMFESCTWTDLILPFPNILSVLTDIKLRSRKGEGHSTDAAESQGRSCVLFKFESWDIPYRALVSWNWMKAPTACWGQTIRSREGRGKWRCRSTGHDETHRHCPLINLRVNITAPSYSTVIPTCQWVHESDSFYLTTNSNIIMRAAMKVDVEDPVSSSI